LSQLLNRLTVLVAPLNWGLGHATRCIPIIKYLLTKNVEVLIASDGAALDLLKEEFPSISAFPLPAYGVRYPYNNMTVNMLLQGPKILQAIKREHTVTQNLVATQDIQIIISDNRFGCYSSKTYNVFMTHQINIMAPNIFTENIISWWNKRMLKRFDLCWVPDFEEAPGLAGKLSHPGSLNSVRYIGPLSRMNNLDLDLEYDVIVVLSGPEPQRSKLEELILQQAVLLPYQFLLVRGVMTDESKNQKGNVTTFGHMKATELERAFAASKVAIARSGYTTVMDLVAMGKRAILIPTPGQTEQIYLGELYRETKRFIVRAQENLDLVEALNTAFSQKQGFKTQGHNSFFKYVNELLQIKKRTTL